MRVLLSCCALVVGCVVGGASAYADEASLRRTSFPVQSAIAWPRSGYATMAKVRQGGRTFTSIEVICNEGFWPLEMVGVFKNLTVHRHFCLPEAVDFNETIVCDSKHSKQCQSRYELRVGNNRVLFKQYAVIGVQLQNSSATPWCVPAMTLAEVEENPPKLDPTMATCAVENDVDAKGKKIKKRTVRYRGPVNILFPKAP